MQIGILGAGNMAGALGAHWVRAGHEVVVSSRGPARARELAGRIGARAGTWEQAARADVVLLAVLAEGVPDVLSAVDLRGKILIDCTNAVVQGEWTLATPTMAADIARGSGARVVKAFNLCPDDVWRTNSVAVPVCGDDPEAVETVKRLVTAMGCRPVDAGGLVRAALLEATAAVVIGLEVAGVDPRTALR
ncbi:MAG: NAD(P)-binding domain-containing protein [Kibdelosporangium sp.]